MIAKIVSAALLGAFLFSTAALADVYVDGYYRADGAYVQPHWRSSPDSSTLNNWSTRGNINPYTGQRGTRSPYPYTTPRSAFQPVQPQRCNPCFYTTPGN